MKRIFCTFSILCIFISVSYGQSFKELSVPTNGQIQINKSPNDFYTVSIAAEKLLTFEVKKGQDVKIFSGDSLSSYIVETKLDFTSHLILDANRMKIGFFSYTGSSFHISLLNKYYKVERKKSKWDICEVQEKIEEYENPLDTNEQKPIPLELVSNSRNLSLTLCTRNIPEEIIPIIVKIDIINRQVKIEKFITSLISSVNIYNRDF